MKLKVNYNQICMHVLGLDKNIRFAGIASLEGKILASKYRSDIQPLLTLQESELSVMQSLMRMSMRKTLEGKLGKTVYATAVYQKVKRSTISLFNEGEKSDAYLMVSFERGANHEALINEKILPFLEKIGKGLR